MLPGKKRPGIYPSQPKREDCHGTFVFKGAGTELRRDAESDESNLHGEEGNTAEQNLGEIPVKTKTMNLKSYKYMEGAEFKERQGSFGFFCARAAEFLTAFHDECRAGWRKLFKRPEKTQQQLEINFATLLNNVFWANWKPKRNRELFA